MRILFFLTSVVPNDCRCVNRCVPLPQESVLLLRFGFLVAEQSLTSFSMPFGESWISSL